MAVRVTRGDDASPFRSVALADLKGVEATFNDRLLRVRSPTKRSFGEPNSLLAIDRTPVVRTPNLGPKTLTKGAFDPPLPLAESCTEHPDRANQLTTNIPKDLGGTSRSCAASSPRASDPRLPGDSNGCKRMRHAEPRCEVRLEHAKSAHMSGSQGSFRGV